MPTLDPESVDSLVTDPPAGISFMGKQWDSHSRYEARTDKGRALLELGKALGLELWEAGFAAFTADWATEAFRVLKPGAHGLVWAIPRTADLTGLGLRAAGFEVRNSVAHIFGSGFPKSLNVSKAIDDFLGVERPVIGTKEQRNPYIGSDGLQFRDAPDYTGQEEQITAAGSAEAAQWEGWGTDLKPSQEAWILIRKPLAEDTVAENILKHGAGAINIDECRVGRRADDRFDYGRDHELPHANTTSSMGKFAKVTPYDSSVGRWPPNIVLSHHPDCKRVGTKKVKGAGDGGKAERHVDQEFFAQSGANGWKAVGRSTVTHSDEDGMETVDAWECVENCPVLRLDAQSGERQSRSRRAGARNGMRYHGADGDGGPEIEASEGGASRFYPQFGWDEEDLQAALFIYAAKASRSERNDKCDDLDERDILWSSGTQNPGSFQAPGTNRKAKNFHPTVKSKALMRWLCRLITPSKGTVLDPFLGSGTTMKAAIEEGFNCIGCEKESDYVKIARARIGGDQLRFDLFAALAD